MVAWLLIGVLCIIFCLAYKHNIFKDDPALPAQSPSSSLSGQSTPNGSSDTEMQITTAPPDNGTTTTTTELTKPFEMPRSAQLDVKPVLQNPELPTGCEVTSLTTLLNYLGYDITKTVLANEFLPVSAVGGVSFNDYFVGSPYIDNSFGCFAPVIVKTAQAYFNSISDTSRTIENLTGAQPSSLYEQVAKGNPVIVWATMNLVAPKERVYWNLPDGTPETWFNYEHCMVLTGFDLDKGLVVCCDPLKGLHTYSMETFELRYGQLLSQAIIIH